MHIKRPFVIMFVSFVLGEVFAVLHIRIIIPIILALLCLLFFAFKRIVYAMILLIICVFIIAGHSAYTHKQNEFNKVNVLENKADITVYGTVRSVEERNEKYYIYLEKVRIYAENMDAGFIRVNRFMLIYSEPVTLKIGNIISAECTYMRFSISRNDGNFQEEIYYHSNGISGKAFVKQLGIVDMRYRTIGQFLSDLRQRLKASIFQSVPPEEAAIFSALLLGDKAELDEDIKVLFQVCGIAHILAISGLHISFVGFNIYKLLRKRSGFIVSGIMSGIIVICFGVMTGSSASAMRAVTMFMISILGSAAGRKYDTLSALGAAGLFLLISNPYYIHHAGFLLSISAVFSIEAIGKALIEYFRVKNRFISNSIIAASIHFMTMPIIAYYYSELPTYSILVNIIIIPLVNIALVSSMLSSLLGLFSVAAGAIALKTGYYTVKLFIWICEIFESLPYSSIAVGIPSVYRLLLYYFIMLSALVFILKSNKIRRKQEKIEKNEDQEEFWWHRYGKRFFVFGLSIFLVADLYVHFHSGMNVYFMDVSQGDGIFMRFPNGMTMFVDGGSTDVKGVGKYRMVPFLKANRVNTIDYAVMTHADDDHINGLKELLEEQKRFRVRIRKLLLPDIPDKDEAYLALETSAVSNGVEVIYIDSATEINVGNVNIKCLNPDRRIMPESRNAYSTVLHITYHQFSMLLTGDVEGSGEDRLYDRFVKEGFGDCTVLKVAHHGSKNSTKEPLLDLISPEISVISCGEGNRYGHPNIELMDRLSMVESNKIYVTTQTGRLRIWTDGLKMKVGRYIE